MAQITSKDRVILQWFCRENEVSEELAEQVGLRRSALYERVGRLVRNGLLQRLGRNQYKLTPAGEKVLLGQQEGLARIWPHLAAIPTAYHLALAELIIAAVSTRISGLFSEHLPSFLLVGPTLCWKTSLGRFLCQAFGLDPARHIITGMKRQWRLGGAGVSGIINTTDRPETSGGVRVGRPCIAMGTKARHHNRSPWRPSVWAPKPGSISTTAAHAAPPTKNLLEDTAMNQKRFIGLDVHKNSITAVFLSQDGTLLARQRLNTLCAGI